MENVGYYNGKFGPLEEMTIPMNDRAVYFGDGCYEATYARNHIIFAIDDHLNRFYSSCQKLRISFHMEREALANTLQEMVNQVDSEDQLMVYWQASRGTGMRMHVFPPEDVKPNLLITIRPLKMRNVYEPMKLLSLEDTRFLHCDIKTLNLIPSVMANQKAKDAGCDEAVLHRGDQVTEGAHSNISILKDGVFKTVPLSNLILPGITRRHLIEICKKKGIPVEEVNLTLEDLIEADEIIVSSSGNLGSGVSFLDGQPVGGKAPELLKMLQDAYQERFKRETER